MSGADDFATRAASGPVAIMAKNSVAANLLMVLLIGGGLMFGLRAKQEVFPEFSTDRISISVAYPGASPEEVEQGVILAIEDQVRGRDGVKEVTSTANEALGSVAVELISGADKGRVLQDIKNVVDSILSFPEEAERPIVSLVEPQRKVITVLVHGFAEEMALRAAAERLRDELLQVKGLTKIELDLARRLEISIEVPEEELRRHGLTLEGVARTVRDHAVELGGGPVRTSGGEILLRTNERRDLGIEFEDIPVLSRADGSQVLLGDIAKIRDGFEDSDEEYAFQGEPAVAVDIYRVGNETPQGVAEIVYRELPRIGAQLPPSITLTPWDDQSIIYQGRVRLLLRNMALGLLLVLLVLGLFLEPRLAFWVTLGIPTSIIGAFLTFGAFDASINMVSLFAFIVTLGIIVDDAIVVGENIYEKRQSGMPALQAAIEGAREISGPVLFAVLTNIAAFMPMFFVPGESGNLFKQIPAVTVSVFMISLIESLFVLPAHLSHAPKPNAFWRIIGWPRDRFTVVFERFTQTVMPRVIGAAVKYRGLTAAIGVGILIIAVGVLAGGHLPFTFLPQIDLDKVSGQVTMPFGIPLSQAREVRDRVIAAARMAEEKSGEPGIIKGILTRIGSPLVLAGAPPSSGATGATGAHLIGVQVELLPPEERKTSGGDFAALWREALGEVPGAESFSISAEIGASGGAAIEIELSHRDRRVLEAAAKDVADRLRRYPAVFELDDGVNEGKPEYEYTLSPAARALGIDTIGLARQVRHSFFGAEALRQQRGRNEIRVMVRRPEEERARASTLETMMLRTPTGGEVPLLEAAIVKEGRADTQIRRREGRRVLAVTADVDEKVKTSNEIVAAFTGAGGDLEETLRRYPGVNWSLEGEQASQAESLDALAVGFGLALMVIFALLAIPLQSYVQPLIIMLAIPFGIIGAIGGHFIHGFGLSLISIFGIVALAGVVVNDSLVLLVTAKQYLDEQPSLNPREAIQRAAVRRFRPILLTSLTTFIGLMPMVLETEVQARFLIPMAISLAYGLAFATFIILLLVPAFFALWHDLSDLFRGAESGSAADKARAAIPVAAIANEGMH